MPAVRQGIPLPETRRRPDWRTGPQVVKGGKVVNAEVIDCIVDQSTFTNATLTSPDINTPDIDGGTIDGATIATSTITEESWNTPTLLNSWVNYGSGETPARYRKDSNGVVHVQGVIKSGTTTSGTNVFLLPSGYRPDANLNIAGVANNAFCNMKMQSTGYLVTRSGWSATFTAFNFSFPT